MRIKGKIRDEKPNILLKSSGEEGHITRQVMKPNLAQREEPYEETTNDIRNERRDDMPVPASRPQQDVTERPKT